MFRHRYMAVTAGSVAALALVASATVGVFAHGVRRAAGAPIPASLKTAYASSPIHIGPSAYAHWKAEKPPYVVGFANSNMGNSWRAQSLADLKRQFALYKKRGLVSRLIVDNANNSVTTQISQIQSLIEAHVNVILINAASETALNPVIKEAYRHHIVVVGFNNIVSSPLAENRDINQATFGAAMAKGLAQLLHGHGNLVMIEGIAGAAGSIIRENAALAVLKHYPGIKIIANQYGNWTETGAKTTMLQILSTHPEPVNAVWQQGGMAIGVISALKQAGRPLVPVSFTGMYNGVDFWLGHLKSGFHSVGATDPPGGSAVALRVGIRILEGQHPKWNAVFNAAPIFTDANIRKFAKPHAAPTSWVDPPTYQYIPTKVLNAYFVNPSPSLSYKAR